MTLPSVPDPKALVMWHVSERQVVFLPRGDVDWIDRTAEAFDAITFAWYLPASGGYIFALMPRRPTVYA